MSYFHSEFQYKITRNQEDKIWGQFFCDLGQAILLFFFELHFQGGYVRFFSVSGDGTFKRKKLGLLIYQKIITDWWGGYHFSNTCWKISPLKTHAIDHDFCHYFLNMPPCMSDCIPKTKTIIQLFLKILAIYYFEKLWACLITSNKNDIIKW